MSFREFLFLDAGRCHIVVEIIRAPLYLKDVVFPIWIGLLIQRNCVIQIFLTDVAPL
jgi:hypothetical protein